MNGSAWASRFATLRGAVVLAVSGGADSVALTRAVLLNRPPDGVVLAHYNHQLRGTASDADADFVEALAKQLHCSFATCRGTVAAAARDTRDNLEATARRLRYAWLAEVARRSGSATICTGHNANDQAETVLHRLLRGSGPQGLRGIAAQRTLESDIVLYRPLLDVTRAEILAFLIELGQPYREDATNRDLRYTRNRIRHVVLPRLAECNPRIVALLGEVASEASAAHAREVADALKLAHAELPRAGSTLVFAASPLASAPSLQVTAFLRHIWQREGWPADGMSRAAWQRLTSLAQGAARAIDLPAGIHARLTEHTFLLKGNKCTKS